MTEESRLVQLPLQQNLTTGVEKAPSQDKDSLLDRLQLSKQITEEAKQELLHLKEALNGTLSIAETPNFSEGLLQESLLEAIDKLIHSGEKSPELLHFSKHLLSSIEQSLQQLIEQRESLSSQKSNALYDIRELERSTAFDGGDSGRERNILQKLRKNLEEKRNAQKLDSLRAQQIILEAKIKAQSSRIVQLASLEEQLTSWRADTYAELIEGIPPQVRNGYAEFYRFMVEESPAISEIRGKIIEVHIQKVLEGLVKRGTLSDVQKSEILSLFMTTFSSSADVPPEKIADLRQTLQQYPGSDYYIEFVDPLLNNSGRNVLRNLTTQMIESDMDELRELAVAGVRDIGARIGTFWTIADKIRSTFGKTQADQFHDNPSGYWRNAERLSADGSSRADLICLENLKSVPVLEESLGGIIEKMSEGIYQELLDKSLSDTQGGYISKLEIYDRPEAIRLLFLLAAADHRNYRTFHANNGLTATARKSNLAEIMDQVVLKYPELEQARPAIENWDHTGQYNQSKVKDFSASIALSVLSEKDADPRLVSLAYEALPTDELINYLTESGLWAESKRDEYRGTQAILEDLKNTIQKSVESSESKEEKEKKKGEVRTLNFGLFKIDEFLRSILLSYTDGDIESGSGTDQQLRERYHRYEALLRLGADNVGNVDRVLALLDYKVLSFVGNVTPEVYADFTQLLSYLSELDEDIGLFEPVLQNLENDRIPQEILDIFKRLSTTFNAGEEKQEVVAALSCFSAGVVSLERAEVLLEEAPALLRTDKAVLQALQAYPDRFFVSDTATGFATKIASLSEDPGTVHRVVEVLNGGWCESDVLIELGEESNKVFNSPNLIHFAKAGLLREQKSWEECAGLMDKYQNNAEWIEEVVEAIKNEELSIEVAKRIPALVPALMQDAYLNLFKFIISKGYLIAKDDNDLKFLRTLIGMHAVQANQLIRDYANCVEEGVVDSSNRALVIEFSKEFRALSPGLFTQYEVAHNSGTSEIFFANLRSMAERMISNKPLTEEERAKPFYLDLIKAMYPHNAGEYTSYDNNASCVDRSQDLEGFKIRPVYRLDLLASAKIFLRQGERLEEGKINSVKQTILGVYEEMRAVSPALEREKLQSHFEEKLEESFSKLKSSSSFPEINLDEIEEVEEKIFLLMIDAFYGNQVVSSDEIKNLIVHYEFAYFDNIEEYVQGTSDRVSLASNQDYALLTELHSFFSDRVKEINRRLVQSGWDDQKIMGAISPLLSGHVAELRAKRKRDMEHRLRVDQLGLSDGFVDRMRRTLSGRGGSEPYTMERTRRAIGLYEAITGGLVDKTPEIGSKRNRAFYGQLQSQREKTFTAADTLGRRIDDPAKTHLDSVDLLGISADEGLDGQVAFNAEEFGNYTIQLAMDLFSTEVTTTEEEIDKFESERGKKAAAVNGYFAKTKETANARMVGGVCVSGDNPKKAGENCQWNMPHYFEFVLQDSETYRCQGLLLLHHFVEDGRKILTVSFNPSSTYLFGVDQHSLFAGLMSVLEQFAQDNDFDFIMSSQNKTIRTNRTKTEFEKAINERVEQAGEQFTFAEEKIFSTNPSYKIKEMDVLWKKV